MLFALAGLLPATALFAQAAAPSAAFDFAHAPVWPGTWTYRPQGNSTEAYFIDRSNTVRLVVRCYRPSRQIGISRTSATAAPELFVWTSFAQRSVPARFEPNAMRVTSDLAARDNLLDAIVFSRGRFAVSMAGALPLVVNPSAEAARVIEDCRI